MVSGDWLIRKEKFNFYIDVMRRAGWYSVLYPGTRTSRPLYIFLVWPPLIAVCSVAIVLFVLEIFAKKKKQKSCWFLFNFLFFYDKSTCFYNGFFLFHLFIAIVIEFYFFQLVEFSFFSRSAGARVCTYSEINSFSLCFAVLI